MGGFEAPLLEDESLDTSSQDMAVGSPSPLEVLRHLSPLNGDFSIEKVAETIRDGKATNIVVMMGAGVSVAAGIPDFRSSDGLFAEISSVGLADDLPSAEAVFSLNYFRTNPVPFYKLVKRIFPGNFKPTKAHFFARILERKGLLRRLYTQNIDGLEVLAGVDPTNIVEAHGGFSEAHCVECGNRYPLTVVQDAICSGNDILVPRCPKKLERPKDPTYDTADMEQSSLCEYMASLSIADISTECTNDAGVSQNKSCEGLLKPNIVFYGEPLPSRFYECAAKDFPKCDMLIVMGTSLKVMPFASLISKASAVCPRILINREPSGAYVSSRAQGSRPKRHNCKDANSRPAEDETSSSSDSDRASRNSSGFKFFTRSNVRDVFLQGDCDNIVSQLCGLLGWTTELEDIMQATKAAGIKDVANIS